MCVCVCVFRLKPFFSKDKKQNNAKKQMPHILCMAVYYALQLIHDSIFINYIDTLAGEYSISELNKKNTNWMAAVEHHQYLIETSAYNISVSIFFSHSLLLCMWGRASEWVSKWWNEKLSSDMNENWIMYERSLKTLYYDGRVKI